MEKRTFRIPWRSIRFNLIMSFFIIIVPLVTLLIYNNFYAINVVHNQVAESNKNMISLYMNQIDNNLEDVNKYITSIASNNIYFKIMASSDDQDEYTFGSIQLFNKIADDIILYKTIDSCFTFSVKMQDFTEVVNSGVVSVNEQERVKKYIIDGLNRNADYFKLNSYSWETVEIDKKYYLIKILKSKDTYIGTWVDTSRIIIPLKLINLGQKGTALLVTDKGELIAHSGTIYGNKIDLSLGFQHYYLTGEKSQYLVVGEKSSIGNFSLVALIPNEKILEKLPYLQRLVTIISITAVIILPIYLLLLWKMVWVPLKQILSAMKKIKEGNIEARIHPYRTSEEFKVVNETFNNMIDQIHDLKISVYEEEINKHKAELEYLQLQINPHFFMNSLNIIFRLAETKKHDLIKEMSLCLLNYFRYVLQDNLTFVPIKDELHHVRNYIRIQELRFSSRSLTYEINVPEYLLNTLVPLMVIHNFVENSIKYALSVNSPTHISIHVDLIENKLKPGISITIKDTGQGFSERILAELRASNKIIDDRGEHIGIWNVQRRLKLLYEDDTSISFSNGDPSGAVVEILLPLEPKYHDRKERIWRSF